MQTEPIPLEFIVSWFLLTYESAYFNQQLEKMNHLEQDLWDCTEVLHIPLHSLTFIHAINGKTASIFLKSVENLHTLLKRSKVQIFPLTLLNSRAYEVTLAISPHPTPPKG